jgi:magnesium transporter
MDYNGEQLNEFDFTDVNQIKDLHSSFTCSWINIYGLHDVAVINDVGTRFNVHSLVLEDVLNTGQRPKLEEFDDFLFLVLKMFRYDQETGVVHAEQLSMVIGKGVLITFQERKGDVFEAVRERIRKMKGRIRQSGVDYLAYALLDTVVDNYIAVIERIGERVEDLGEKVLEEPDKKIIADISNAKREVN